MSTNQNLTVRTQLTINAPPLPSLYLIKQLSIERSWVVEVQLHSVRGRKRRAPVAKELCERVRVIHRARVALEQLSGWCKLRTACPRDHHKHQACDSRKEH